MANSLFQSSLNWFYKAFKDNTSKMLIVTGAAGWALSCAAQCAAILANNKVSTEKKSFLFPQELTDGVVNVLSFLIITLVAKQGIEKLVSTGKILPKSVRNFLNKNKSLYHNKVGKLDFNVENVLKAPENKQIKKSYDAYKNYVTTVGTVGASILACNVITPLIRNKTASRVQKTYIDMKNNPGAYITPGSNMKV